VDRGGEKQARRANWALEEFGPRGEKEKERRERREVGRAGWIGRKMEWAAGRKRKRGFDPF
jgi:hypothetical protein